MDAWLEVVGTVMDDTPLVVNNGGADKVAAIVTSVLSRSDSNSADEVSGAGRIPSR
jgi:hypothetical protein